MAGRDFASSRRPDFSNRFAVKHTNHNDIRNITNLAVDSTRALNSSMNRKKEGTKLAQSNSRVNPGCLTAQRQPRLSDGNHDQSNRGQRLTASNSHARRRQSLLHSCENPVELLETSGLHQMMVKSRLLGRLPVGVLAVPSQGD